MPILPIRSEFLNDLVEIVRAGTLILSHRIYPSITKDIERDEMILVLNFHRLNQLEMQRRLIEGSDDNIQGGINPLIGLPGDSHAFLSNTRGVKDLTILSNYEKRLKKTNTIFQIVQLLLQQSVVTEVDANTTFQITLPPLKLSKCTKVIGKKKISYRRARHALLGLGKINADYPELQTLASNVLQRKEDMDNAWAEYSSVAHLIFAYTALSDEHKPLCKPESLILFLNIAYHIQEFLLSIQYHKSFEATIKRRRMWTISSKLPFLKKHLDFIIPKAHPRIQDKLDAYMRSSIG